MITHVVKTLPKIKSNKNCLSTHSHPVYQLFNLYKYACV